MASTLHGYSDEALKLELFEKFSSTRHIYGNFSLYVTSNDGSFYFQYNTTDHKRGSSMVSHEYVLPCVIQDPVH
jgi:hypothetical protein